MKFNEKNDSFLLCLNSKAVALWPDFGSMAMLGETVAKDRPEAAFDDQGGRSPLRNTSAGGERLSPVLGVRSSRLDLA